MIKRAAIEDLKIQAAPAIPSTAGSGNMSVDKVSIDYALVNHRKNYFTQVVFLPLNTAIKNVVLLK